MKRLLSPKWLGPLIIVLAVLLVNIPYISGFTNPNPINSQSGLMIGHNKKLLGGLYTIDPNDGTTTQALGHQAATQILHGHVPWWNYDEQVGAPLAGGMQSASFFPLTLLLGFSTGVLYFHIILEIIAGLATYYLLKRLRFKNLTAIVGGVLFALNGTFAWLGNATVNPIAFLPLLLLGIEIAYEKTTKKQKRGWLIIALALALSIYAGFPEVAFLDTLLTVLWAIVRVVQLRKGERQKFVFKILAGFIVGLILTAPLLIAFTDYLPGAYVGIHQGGVDHIALSYIGLPMLVFPYIYGTIFGYFKFDPTGTIPAIWSNVGGYITLSILLLAVVGLFDKKQRPLKILLMAWIAIAVARIYGLPGVAHILKLIPYMNSVAVYRYVQPSMELAAIVLAMFGFERLFYNKKPIAGRQLYYPVAIVGLIIVALLAIAYKGRKLLATAPHHNLVMVASLAWGLVCLAIIIICALGKFKYRKIICAVVLIADTMLMFAIPTLSAPRSPTIDTQPVSYLQSHLGTYRLYSLGPLAPNYGSYFGVASIDTNNLPLSKNWTNYITRSLDINVDPTIFDGTSEIKMAGPDAAQSLLAHLAAYEYIGVKYIVAFHSSLSSSEIATGHFTQVFSDQTVDVYQLPNPASYFQITRGSCSVTMVNKSEIDANCKTPSQLLRRELYVAGWTARAGNQAVKVMQSGPLFQSIKLPVGHYKVRFNYSPPHIIIGWLLLIVGGLAVIATFLRYTLSRR